MTIIKRLTALEANQFDIGTLIARVNAIAEAIGVDTPADTTSASVVKTPSVAINAKTAKELYNIDLGRDKEVTGRGTEFIIYDRGEGVYVTRIHEFELETSNWRDDALSFTRAEIDAMALLFFNDPVKRSTRYHNVRYPAVPNLKVYDVETGELAFIFDWKN